MTDLLAIEIARSLARKRHLSEPGFEYRDLLLLPHNTRSIEATDELYAVLEADPNVVIVSEQGVYDVLNSLVSECCHLHANKLEISNYGTAPQRVVLLRIFWP